MTYHKISVDNTKCLRRFHLAFDDELQPQAEVVIKCPHCAHTVFEARNHPPSRLIREENLVTINNLSQYIVNECDYKDKFPPNQTKKP